MLTRKRKYLLDDYLESLSIPFDRKQKADQFFENLRLFYKRKWGCTLKSPYVNGKELNLFNLYEAVTSLGGWQKITSFDRWNEVLQRLSIDENIQLAEHAIRFIYMQYLSRFEQNENGGDIVEEHENELLGGRSNRMKGINAIACYYEPPFTSNKAASTNSSVPNFNKLIFSLLSGLPNEVSFGLNVLTIMSHPGPFVLNFSHCPALINIMVALAGVTVNSHESATASELHDWWIESSKYDMTRFWLNAGIQEKELYGSVYNPKRLEPKQSNLFEALNSDKFDLTKPINWRIFNILGIFNNLSYEDVNLQQMGESKNLLRFLLLCCNSKWQILKKAAYETLSNISKNINLSLLDGEPSLIRVLRKTIQHGLHSMDKFKLLRSMEILAGLCQIPKNELTICDFIEESQAISRIFTVLSLKDILICVVSLETLLQISELGKTSCELISSLPNAINVLVGMLTSDAASFGQAGLYGIKVVEVRGHHMQPYVNPNKKYLPPPPLPMPPNQAPGPASSSLQTPSSASHQLHNGHPETQADMTVSRHLLSSKTPQPVHHPVQMIQEPHSFVSEYMCEWMMVALDENEEIEPCSKFFLSASQLLYHIYNDHLKTLVASHVSSKNPEEVCLIRCRWPLCDNTPRTLWSMTTHLQDVHCTEYNLEMNLRKRYEIGFDEYINQIRQHYEKNKDRDQQPGYTPFAAYEAIRRHAFVNLKKDITDDSEGPVTRNLRLTAALILRNVCKNSISGRRKLHKYETLLSWLTLSKMEAARILAQCMAEIVSNQPSAEIDQQPTNEEFSN